MNEHGKIKVQINQAVNRFDLRKILLFLRKKAIHGGLRDETEELDFLVYGFKHSTNAPSESEMQQWKSYIQRLADRIYTS